MLGGDRPVAYTDTVSYFKVHFPDRPSRVICRLYFETRRPRVLVPVPISKVESYLNNHKVSFPQVGWIAIALDDPSGLKDLGDIIRATYDFHKAEKLGQAQDRDDEGPTATESFPLRGKRCSLLAAALLRGGTQGPPGRAGRQRPSR